MEKLCQRARGSTVRHLVRERRRRSCARGKGVGSARRLAREGRKSSGSGTAAPVGHEKS